MFGCPRNRAGTLVGSDAALGVLPMGTLNHFAKDVGIPQNLEAAVRNIFTGQVKPRLRRRLLRQELRNCSGATGYGLSKSKPCSSAAFRTIAPSLIGFINCG
jgi:Diacylglycerol kinase catalytic domain